jgi:hypothetical protein
MLKYFTNAAEEHRGKPIAINRDGVMSVFEFERDVPTTEEKKSKKKEPDRETITVIFGATGNSWEIKESMTEVVNRLNEPN